MQNLTAHYNILFNARQIVLQKQELMAQVYVDDFSEILSVYQDTIAKTAAASKDIEAVTSRANTIISLKEQSHYLGDAYFLLGQANYLGNDYFNAVEFFDYVIHSFPENKELARTAMAWKARALIKLNKPKDAASTLDTARQMFDAKKPSTVDITGTDLQFNIDQGNYEQAEKLAVQAIDLAKDRKTQIRWTFILAQIREANKEPATAYDAYSRVVRSNASFELAFNANLNRLRLEERKDGKPTDRITRLKTLLKDDKNTDFIDQIYFQMGETDLAQKQIDDAIKNYKLSVKNSIKNQKQKGLSYLRLADINFKYKSDYILAKKYYDSTLQNLSPIYPGYQQILKKANNLQLLASRYQIIAQQDTLQALAKMKEADRAARINLMVDQQIIQKQGPPAVSIPFTNNGSALTNNTPSSFYFYNPAAVSQGLVSFLQIWGKRRLEDNWRISSLVIATVAHNPNEVSDPDVAEIAQATKLSTPGAANYRQHLANSIPLNPVQLQQSNQIIFNAYADIGSFYKDILSDNKESINTYEYLLTRFPDNPNLAVIYYSLYRLYTDERNQPLAEKYRNLLLKNYPQTQYAQIILDPEYGKKMLSEDAQQNTFYNNVYDFYQKRQYDQVIALTDSALKINPQGKQAAQLAYLKTIALGHQQKLEPFKLELQQIVAQYPDNRLVTPLVKQHLLFINANEALIAARPFALIDSDPNEIPFSQDRFVQSPTIVEKPVSTPMPVPPAVPVVLSAAKNSTNIASAPATLNNKVSINLPISTKKSMVKEASGIFSVADSTDLYFVINVTGSNNLAPSRFGIGQFNRANYPDVQLKHQLKEVQTNQLIYTGRFYSIGEVKEYARRIVPLLPEIMKVPAEKYNFFIISRKNLDKLATSKLLDSYFEFYQANYL